MSSVVSNSSNEQGIQQFSFRTADLPEAEQFSHFANAMSVVADLVLPQGVSPTANFVASQDGYQLGQIGFLVSRCQNVTLLRSKQHAAQFGSDDWMLWLNLTGPADIVEQGIVKRIEKGSFSLYDLETPTEGHFTKCAGGAINQTAFVFLPRRLFGGIEHLLNDMTRIRGDGVRFHPLFNHYLRDLIEMLPQIPSSEAQLFEQATVAMVHACVMPNKDNVRSARKPILETQFSLAKKYILAHLHAPGLNREALQRALGISNRQLYYVFEKVGGVDRYIQEQRLAACFTCLADKEEKRSVADIAEHYGFMDASNFSRMFKRRYESTPGQVRSAFQHQHEQVRLFSTWLNSRNRSAEGPD